MIMVLDILLSDPRLGLLSIPAVWVLNLTPAFLNVRSLPNTLPIVLYPHSYFLSERDHRNVRGLGQVTIHICI